MSIQPLSGRRETETYTIDLAYSCLHTVPVCDSTGTRSTLSARTRTSLNRVALQRKKRTDGKFPRQVLRGARTSHHPRLFVRIAVVVRAE